MTDTTVKYIANHSSFWKKILDFFEIVGYSRAASELVRLGYYEEAKNCMLQIKKLRD